MVLVKSAWLIAVVLAVVLGIALLAGMGYLAIVQAPAMTMEKNVYAAERFLFAGFVVLGVCLLLLAVLWIGGVRVLRLLDRIHELSRVRGVPPENRLFRLGALGSRITALLSTLTEINRKRADRISALSDLATFLSDNIALMLVVTDPRGTIRYASNMFLERTGQRRSDLVGKPIESVIEEIRPMEVLALLTRNRGSRKVDVDDRLIHSYAIYDGAGRVLYVVSTLEWDAVYTLLSAEGSPDREHSPVERRLSTVLWRIFGETNNFFRRTGGGR